MKKKKLGAQKKEQLYSFQFDDAGVPRDGVGRLVQVLCGGMFEMEFDNSNLKVAVLPATVRPVNLRRKIHNAVSLLVDCATRDAFSGSLAPKDAEIVKQNYKLARKNFMKLARSIS